MDVDDIIGESLDTQVRRGEQAARILSEPLVVEAFELIRANLVDKFFDTKESDSELRERVFRMNLACREFERYFREIIESGKMASFEIEEKKQRRSRKATATVER